MESHHVRQLGLLLLFAAASASGRDFSLGAELSGSPRASLDYRVTLYSESAIGMMSHELSAMVPVSAGKRDTFSFTAEGELTQLDSGGAALPASKVPIPDRLTELSAGLRYTHRYGLLKALDLSASVGTATDQPFATPYEMVFSAGARVLLPSGEMNAWILGASYSTNRPAFQFLPEWAPIPIAAFLWNPTMETHVLLGIPFLGLSTKLRDGWRLSLIGTLGAAHAVTELSVFESLALYGEYDWKKKGYLLVDRVNPGERLVYGEMRAAAGLRAAIVRQVSLDVGGGYAFDRSLNLQWPQIGSIDGVGIGGAWYLSFQIKVNP